jgi:peptide/nickel transport system permease protein
MVSAGLFPARSWPACSPVHFLPVREDNPGSELADRQERAGKSMSVCKHRGSLGAVSAYVGGWVDEVIHRFVEIVLAFSFLLAALTLATVLIPKFHTGLVSGMIALIALGWPGYSRLIRGDVLTVKERDYVLAARAVGVPGWRILLRHVLPNAIYSLLVVGSLDIGTYVLTFAALSFLGLGAEQGYADWGQLPSFARNWIPDLARFWYIVVYPGAALLLFVLGWNLIGDAFRDALDPKMRGYRVG